MKDGVERSSLLGIHSVKARTCAGSFLPLVVVQLLRNQRAIDGSGPITLRKGHPEVCKESTSLLQKFVEQEEAIVVDIGFGGVLKHHPSQMMVEIITNVLAEVLPQFFGVGRVAEQKQHDE
jgi:hypothetical protein